MDTETQRSIEEAVLEILRNANMEEMTEYKVRSLAADRLGIDLSLPGRKRFVRSVVESFLASQKEDSTNAADAADAPQEDQRQVEVPAVEDEEAEDVEDDPRRRHGRKEYDDEGNLIVCRVSDLISRTKSHDFDYNSAFGVLSFLQLSNKRRVTVQDFRGKTLVSIREYYEKEGKQLPTSKGISLSVEQWEAFAKAVPAIEDAIKKIMGSD